MQDRIDQLKAITGLPVCCHTMSRRAGTVNYFVFGHESHPIKTVWTYRKAKIFAEGFAAGRAAAAYPPGATNEG
jgi:hypothetical protein